MAIRVQHSQASKGLIMLTDVDDGLPRKEFAYLKKQPIYVPYENPDDVSQPGFVDLVESDKAVLSTAMGVIKGLADKGEVAFTENFTPAEPTVTSATWYSTGLDIEGTDLVSTAPAVTVVNVGGMLGGSTPGTEGMIFGGVSLNESKFAAHYATGISIDASQLPAVFRPGAVLAVKADSNVSGQVGIVAG